MVDTFAWMFDIHSSLFLLEILICPMDYDLRRLFTENSVKTLSMIMEDVLI